MIWFIIVAIVCILGLIAFTNWRIQVVKNQIRSMSEREVTLFGKINTNGIKEEKFWSKLIGWIEAYHWYVGGTMFDTDDNKIYIQMIATATVNAMEFKARFQTWIKSNNWEFDGIIVDLDEDGKVDLNSLKKHGCDLNSPITELFLKEYEINKKDLEFNLNKALETFTEDLKQGELITGTVGKERL